MKKFILTLIIAGVLQLTLLQVNAQTPTTGDTPSPTVTGSQSVEDKIIETFKEKVATKVAELRKKNVKPAVGRITSNKGDTIALQAKDGNYTVKVDENLTNIYQLTNGTKKEIKQTDLKKGDYIIVDGPQLDKVVTANVILKDEEYFTKVGKITEVNSSDDYLKIVTSEKDVITLDIPTGMKMQLVNSKTLEIEPATMSKVKEGDTIHFVYKKTGEEKVANRYDAERILIIPQEYFQK